MNNDREIQSFLLSSSHEGEGTIVKMIHEMGKDFGSLERMVDGKWKVRSRIHRYPGSSFFESFENNANTVSQAVCGAYMQWEARKPPKIKEK